VRFGSLRELLLGRHVELERRQLEILDRPVRLKLEAFQKAEIENISEGLNRKYFRRLKIKIFQAETSGSPASASESNRFIFRPGDNPGAKTWFL
jgi:hypothetical protein